MPAVQDEQRSTLPPEGGVTQDPILWVVPALRALFSRPAPNDAAIREARAHSSDDVSLLTQLLNAAGFSAVPRALSAAEIAQQARPLVALLRNDGNSDSHAADEAGLVL